MSDQKISGRTETTTLSSTDLMYVLRDPSSASLDRKITIANLAANLINNKITAASMTVDTGTLSSGTVTTTQTKDGTSVDITEAAGADPLRVRFGFTGVSAITGILTCVRYTGGSSHEIHLEIYNNSEATWEKLREITQDPGLTWYNSLLYNGAAYINSGAVTIRFYHITSGINTHHLYIDYIALLGW